MLNTTAANAANGNNATALSTLTAEAYNRAKQVNQNTPIVHPQTAFRGRKGRAPSVKNTNPSTLPALEKKSIVAKPPPQTLSTEQQQRAPRKIPTQAESIEMKAKTMDYINNKGRNYIHNMDVDPKETFVFAVVKPSRNWLFPPHVEEAIAINAELRDQLVAVIKGYYETHPVQKRTKGTSAEGALGPLPETTTTQEPLLQEDPLFEEFPVDEQW